MAGAYGTSWPAQCLGRVRLLVSGFALALLILAAARGDVVELNSGGVIRGTVLDDESDQEWVTVLLDVGKNAKVRIKREQIKRILRAKDLEEEYRKRVEAGDGSLEHHLEMARWCERYRMKAKLLLHLKAAAKIDPQNRELRLIAARNGYLDDLFPPKEDEVRKEHGLVKDRGRLVTPQQKRLLDEERARKAKEREWMRVLADLKRTVLSEGSLAIEGAKTRLLAVDEPEAYAAVLRQFLQDKRPALRVLGCYGLYNLPDPRATTKLVELALEDPAPEVRYAAIDALKHRDDPAAVRKLIKALRSSRNEQVRLAAIALEELGDESAVPALIDALVTEHLVIRGRPNAIGAASGGIGIGALLPSEEEGFRLPLSVGGLTPVFGQPVAQGGGLTVGGPRVLRIRVANPEVRQALVKLTGEDFGFDEKRWKDWYVQVGRLKQQRQRRELGLP